MKRSLMFSIAHWSMLIPALIVVHYVLPVDRLWYGIGLFIGSMAGTFAAAATQARKEERDSP